MKKQWLKLGILILTVLSSGCSGPPGSIPPPVVQPPPAVVEKKLIASFYGNAFKGRKTASGEIFDPKKLTAAHRRYPFGTLLKVTNVENGKSVQVRVNDRGPFIKNREIDLSAAAAHLLGMKNDGVAEVIIAEVSK